MRDTQIACNNLANCHDPEIISEDNSAIRVYCKECGAQERIGKNINGDPEHRLYGNWYKRDVVQPDHPLYYKYAGKEGMRLI
jgi:hypothetical protein